MRSIIFGIFGIVCSGVVIVVLVVAIAAAMGADPHTARYINCPQCLDRVPLKAANCPHCGRKMR